MSDTSSAASGWAVADGDVDLPLRVPEDGVTEILVHGVGGASAPAMLGEAMAQQVTGDQVAGMWRGADQDVGCTGDQRLHREAYSWGGLTSRAVASALWLLLTPFALFNVAGWMALGRPRHGDGRPDWRIGYQQALVRVLGLFTTLTYVLFVAQIAMDFGTWQCTQVDDCRLNDWPRGVSAGLAGRPARAVVLAAVVPLLGVAGLYWLSRRTTQLYEDYRPTSGAGGSAAVPSRDKERLDPAAASLTDQRFWTGAGYADRTRLLHLIAAVLLISMLLLAVAAEGVRWPSVVNALMLAVGAALAVVVVCAGWHRPRGWLLDGRAGRVAAWLVTYAFLIAAAVLAWLQPIPAKAAGRGVMPGMLEAFNAIVMAVLFFAAVHAVVACTGRLAARPSGGIRLPRVPAPFIAVSVGACLLFAVWCGVAVWAAQWLSPSAKPQAALAAADHLVYPAGYQALAQASFLGLLAIAAVMGIVLLFRRIFRYPKLDKETQEWNGAQLPGWIEASTLWQRRVRWRKWTADLAFWIELALGLVSVLATVGGLGYVLWFARRWVGWTGAGRIVGAVTAFAIGLTLLAWLSIRTKPLPGRGRHFGSWVQIAVGLVAFAAGIAGAAAVGAPLAQHFDQRPVAPLIDFAWMPGAGLSSTILTAIPIAAILLLRRAIKDQHTRRLVGTAWDVATFWPRAFHPLAPPSYAERAVPELTYRIRYLLRNHHAVLLLGHSQGAVLTAATLAQLTNVPAAQRRRLSVITYGNPVTNLYMRWFPHYVNRELIDAARAADTAEIPIVNYYRYTDPVGRRYNEMPVARTGPPPRQHADPPADIGRPPVEDRWLPDPPINRHRIGYGEPQVRGHAHSGYIRQANFADYILAEVKRLNEIAE